MNKNYFFLGLIMITTSNNFLHSMKADGRYGPVMNRAYNQAILKGGKNAALCTAIFTAPTLFMHRDSTTEKIMIPVTSTAASFLCGAFFAGKAAEKTVNHGIFIPQAVLRRGTVAGSVTGTVIGIGTLSILYLKSLYLNSQLNVTH